MLMPWPHVCFPPPLTPLLFSIAGALSWGTSPAFYSLFYHSKVLAAVHEILSSFRFIGADEGTEGTTAAPTAAWIEGQERPLRDGHPLHSSFPRCLSV